MKFLKNEKWKLEPITKQVSLCSTIFYGLILFLIGLVYLSMYINPNGTLENSVLGVAVFGLLLLLYISLYYSMLIYVIPVLVVIFLVSVAFTELVKRNNPRVFIHPLVISAVVTAIAGTFIFLNLIESAF